MTFRDKVNPAESLCARSASELVLGTDRKINEIPMRMKQFPWIISALAIGLASCQKPSGMSQNPTIKQEIFGKMPDGREVKLFTLTNANGLKARVMEYGAILVSMETPDRTGKSADLTHGYDTLEGWLGNTSYFGSSVGRFGNRIKDGKFTLDGKAHTLATNNKPGGIPCALHGGTKGFDKVLWSGKAIANHAVEFTYVSKDGEEGYPGNLTVKVTYTLTEANELKWEAQATTDAPTVLNIVHHSYWNLSGDPTTSINDHELQLVAPTYLPTDAGLIPTGVLAPVVGTPMDFTKSTAIGARVGTDFEALVFGGGYDHCWVLEKGQGVRLAARLKDPKSGRVMEISTNQPAIQFYGGNFLDGTATGKKAVPYAHRTALCLETEGFPDAPNQPAFPTAVLRPGETYHHVMIHKFSAE
jgi:aldose 1-epimerase